jgi:hypothetical protein
MGQKSMPLPGSALVGSNEYTRGCARSLSRLANLPKNRNHTISVIVKARVAPAFRGALPAFRATRRFFAGVAKSAAGDFFCWGADVAPPMLGTRVYERGTRVYEKGTRVYELGTRVYAMGTGVYGQGTGRVPARTLGPAALPAFGQHLPALAGAFRP